MLPALSAIGPERQNRHRLPIAPPIRTNRRLIILMPRSNKGRLDSSRFQTVTFGRFKTIIFANAFDHFFPVRYCDAVSRARRRFASGFTATGSSRNYRYGKRRRRGEKRRKLRLG